MARTAHVALLPFPGYGHVTPTLAVARELVRRGHRVTFPTTDEFVAPVAATGATPVPYRSMLAGRPLPAAFTTEYVAHEPLRCIQEGQLVTAQLREVYAADVPDLVVYDVSTFPTGRALAELFGRPGLQLFPVFASNERFSFGTAQAGELDEVPAADHPAILEFLRRTESLLAEHGLDGDVERFLRPCDDRNLVFLPREFQLCADEFDDRHAFVGPCLSEAPSAGDWVDEDDDRPLVLLSMGTTFNDDPDFLRRSVRAFAGVPWRVVVTVGRNGVDPGELGEPPGNVEVHRWVPFPVLVPRASVLVCHAGMGSLMEAFTAGVPVVTAPPDVTEHRLNARRATTLGLGATLDRRTVTPEALRDTVLAVAADSDIRDRVRRMRDDTRRAGGPERAADVIGAALAG